MELDPTLPEAQIREADLKFYWDWDWSQCDGPFRRAAQEAIESSDVQTHYALCLEVLGRFNEALPHMENARKIDPLSTMLNLALGRLLVRTGQVQKGLEYLYKAKDLDPNDPAIYEQLAWPTTSRIGKQKQSRRALRLDGCGVTCRKTLKNWPTRSALAGLPRSNNDSASF
jgi:tetratricopeptide (TPR) repeat protein